MFRRKVKDPSLEEIRLEETMVTLKGLSRHNQRILVQGLSKKCMKRCWVCLGKGKNRANYNSEVKGYKKGDIITCFHCLGLGRVWDDNDKY